MSDEPEAPDSPSQEPAADDEQYCKPVLVAAMILGCFTAKQPVLGVSDIARRLDMQRPTAHRYLATLTHIGYTEEAVSRRYRLASGAADAALNWLHSMPLRRDSRTVLCELRERFGYTTSLAILDGCDILYLDRRLGWRQGQYAIDAGTGVGARMPAHCTAAGKALLANLLPQDRAKVLSAMQTERRGLNTITSLDALSAELTQVLTAGFAISDEEIEGVRSIAATIIDTRGDVRAAIEVAAPTSAVSRESLIESFSSPVRSAAMRIVPPAPDSPEGHPASAPEALELAGAIRKVRYSKSVERGLTVLGSFTPARAELGLRDIATPLQLSISGASFHIRTLEWLGCVERATGSRYRLAAGVTRLGMSALGSTTLQEHARPFLLELCEEFSCFASLTVLDGTEILYLERVKSLRTRAGTPNGVAAGSRLPAHLTATGKLLLAYLPKKEKERFIATNRTSIPNSQTLRTELHQIRAEGVAVSEGLTTNERAIATPVRGANGEVIAAANLVMYTSAISVVDLRGHIAPRLTAATARISARLGYRPTEEYSNGHGKGTLL